MVRNLKMFNICRTTNTRNIAIYQMSSCLWCTQSLIHSLTHCSIHFISQLHILTRLVAQTNEAFMDKWMANISYEVSGGSQLDRVVYVSYFITPTGNSCGKKQK